MSTAAEPRSRRAPGESALWVFVLGDMTVFALLFGAFLYDRSVHPEVFARSVGELHVAFGAVNTIVLLTSSLLVAGAVQAHRRGVPTAAGRMLAGSVVLAALFVASKALEWGTLLSDGLGPSTDAFFTYYFAITGLHLLHLGLGLAALMVLWRISRRTTVRRHDAMVVESGASYWHMVDLLWIVIFPLVYFCPA